jgi:hypothetical protein
MRKLALVAIFWLTGLATFAQAPSSFKYQAIVRNGAGATIANQTVNILFQIREGSPNGPLQFEETHLINTNAIGLVNLDIGSLTPDSLNKLDWGTETYFIRIELDPTGGTNFQFMGTSQFSAVPYAFQAYDVQTKQDLELNGSDLRITGNTNATDIDMSPFLDNTDDQSIFLDAGRLILSRESRNDTIDLSSVFDQVDTNEIDIALLKANATADSLALATHIASDLDTDPTNELIDSVRLVNDSFLYVFEGGDTMIIDLTTLDVEGGIDDVLGKGNNAQGDSLVGLSKLVIGDTSSLATAFSGQTSTHLMFVNDTFVNAAGNKYNTILVKSRGRATTGAQSATYFEINGTGGDNYAVDATSNGTSTGTNIGLDASSGNATTNVGVRSTVFPGLMPNPSSMNRAILGQVQTIGLWNEALSGFATGSGSTTNTGAHGQAQNSTGTNRGVVGAATGNSGEKVGVLAAAEGSGTNRGILVQTNDPAGNSNVALLAESSGGTYNRSAVFKGAEVDIRDGLIIRGDTTAGYVLTTDNIGRATWQQVSARPLDEVLAAGSDAGNDTIYNLNSLAIGSSSANGNALQVDGGFVQINDQLNVDVSGATQTNEALSVRATGSTALNNYGIRAEADSATDRNIAVSGITDGSNGTTANYGVFGDISGDNTGIKRGVVGVLTDSADLSDAAIYGIANGLGDNIAFYGRSAWVPNANGRNIALYTRAANAAENWAAWFNEGNVKVEDTLYITDGAQEGYVLMAMDSTGKSYWAKVADADSTNELITGFSLNTSNDELDLTEAGVTNTVDLTIYRDTAAINANAANIATNASGVSTNASGITTNAGNITSNTSSISTNTTNITTNTSGVSTNAAGITTNAGNITSNTSSISTNTTNITTNTSGVSTNAAGITTNAGNITSNTSSISTNTTNIATNTSGVSTNASGITTNAGNITTNATNIGTNTTNINSHISSDLDLDSTNEKISTMQLLGDSLEINEGGLLSYVDLGLFNNSSPWNDSVQINNVLNIDDEFIFDGPRLRVLNTNDNILIGDSVGATGSFGSYNTIIGMRAGAKMRGVNWTTAIGGASTLRSLTSGSNNVVLGADNAETATNFSNNVSIGSGAFRFSSGSSNVNIGESSLRNNTSGSFNVAIGRKSMTNNSGSNNTSVGYYSGASGAGSGNVYLGAQAGRNNTASNLLFIENTSSATPLIYGDFNADSARINGDLGVSQDIHAHGEMHSDSTGSYNLLPIAIGQVDWTGVVLNGTGNFTVNHPSTGRYEITISGVSFNINQDIAIATLAGSIGFVQLGSLGGDLLVFTYNTSGTLSDARFTFTAHVP